VGGGGKLTDEQFAIKQYYTNLLFGRQEQENEKEKTLLEERIAKINGSLLATIVQGAPLEESREPERNSDADRSYSAYHPRR
jgi:hypothetical protein